MSSKLDCPIDLCTPKDPVELISVGTNCSNAKKVTESDGSSSRAESSLLLSADKSEPAVVRVILADSVTLAATTPAKAVEVTSAMMSRANLLKLVESEEFQIVPVNLREL